jgi:hypothetical protein
MPDVDEPPGDEPDDRHDAEPDGPDDHYVRPVDSFRRSAAGAVVSAGLLGLRDALEGRPEREETVIVNDAPAQPRGDIELSLDPEHPERSVVVVHRPAADAADPPPPESDPEQRGAPS